MSEAGRVCASITFIEEAHSTPEIGEAVRLHIAKGPWCSGLSCLSSPFTEDGERRVWIATEEEYRLAQREGQELASDTWPISQMAVADE